MKKPTTFVFLLLSLVVTHGADSAAPRGTVWMNAVPPGLVTCSNLTLALGGQPVWVEHLAKECPADAPNYFRRNASTNLTVAIASFPCPSPGQQSAFSIICDGPATVRNVTFEDIRVEENITRLFELNVTDGQFYTRTAPGQIQNVRLKNIQWETSHPILITGHTAAHQVEGVVFEGCRVAGQPLVATQIQTNAFVQHVVVQYESR